MPVYYVTVLLKGKVADPRSAVASILYITVYVWADTNIKIRHCVSSLIMLSAFCPD